MKSGTTGPVPGVSYKSLLTCCSFGARIKNVKPGFYKKVLPLNAMPLTKRKSSKKVQRKAKKDFFLLFIIKHTIQQ